MPARRVRVRLIQTGVLLLLALAFIWFASRWRYVGVFVTGRTSSYATMIVCGALELQVILNVDSREAREGRGIQAAYGASAETGSLIDADHHPHWRWKPKAHWSQVLPTDPFEFAFVVIPLWIPCLVLAAPITCLFLRDLRANRLARSNSCPHCSYSLKGLPPTSLCPECGKTQAAAP